eukprot:745676-Pelagomonas_calceolata.AAC.1
MNARMHTQTDASLDMRERVKTALEQMRAALTRPTGTPGRTATFFPSDLLIIISCGHEASLFDQVGNLDMNCCVPGSGGLKEKTPTPAKRPCALRKGSLISKLARLSEKGSQT